MRRSNQILRNIKVGMRKDRIDPAEGSNPKKKKLKRKIQHHKEEIEID